MIRAIIQALVGALMQAAREWIGADQARGDLKGRVVAETELKGLEEVNERARKADEAASLSRTASADPGGLLADDGHRRD